MNRMWEEGGPDPRLGRVDDVTCVRSRCSERSSNFSSGIYSSVTIVSASKVSSAEALRTGCSRQMNFEQQ